MSSLVSINPQVHCHAVAFWLDGALTGARIMTLDQVKQLAEYAREELVIEVPQIYVASRMKGDPNDLIDLAFSAGRVAALFQQVTKVRPSDWKGQIPKPKHALDAYIVEHRARKKLRAEEIVEVDEPKNSKLRWDVWDAVAIGLFVLKR